jgi:Arc-like DNA binding domain
VARKLADTVKLQVRLSERLRRRLEQAAKHHDWSMNTEIVNRLDSSLQGEELEQKIGGVIERAVQDTATKTARRLEQELRQRGLIPDQMARPQEATRHPAPPDKEEHAK